MSVIGQRGDDLEDDFVPDDLVASSGDEAFDAPGDSIDAFLSADEEAEQDEPVAKGKTASAKRKRREKDRERKAKRPKFTETVEVEPVSVAAQPPTKLVDYMSTMQAKVFPELTTLELDDLRIPEIAIEDTTQWTGLRTLDRLTDFIIQVLPMLHKRLSQRSKSSGAPTLLYIAGAAVRVADVTRVLKNKRLRGDKGGDVAKLFARHFKLEEQVAYLERSKIGSAAGTPGRVGKLLCETDALSVSQLTHIILDISFRDAKDRNLLEIPEARDDVFKTVLGAPKVLEGIRQGKIHVVLF